MTPTDFAIADALRRRTLYLAYEWSEHQNEPYATIEDEHGPIEKHTSMRDAQNRVAHVKSVYSE